MTDPGYPGASSPDPNAPQAPGVPGQYPPPAAGYGAPMPPAPFTPAPPPPGYANSDEKTWALVAHFGGAAGNLFCGFLGFVAPLVALLSKGSTSPTVRQHAVNALNFQIPVSGVALIILIVREIAFSTVTGTGFAFGTLLVLVEWVVAIIGVVFGVMAGIKANEGVVYKYPISLGLIK